MASASSSASRANTVESLPAASNRNEDELPTPQRGVHRVDDALEVVAAGQGLGARDVEPQDDERGNGRAQVQDRQRADPSGHVEGVLAAGHGRRGAVEHLALYDAIDRGEGVILATGEVDDQGGARVLGGDKGLAEAGARAAASTFPTDAGGAIRRYAREDTGLGTIPAVVGERFGKPMEVDEALIDFHGQAGAERSDVLVRGRLAGRLEAARPDRDRGRDRPVAAGRAHDIGRADARRRA